MAICWTMKSYIEWDHRIYGPADWRLILQSRSLFQIKVLIDHCCLQKCFVFELTNELNTNSYLLNQTRHMDCPNQGHSIILCALILCFLFPHLNTDDMYESLLIPMISLCVSRLSTGTCLLCSMVKGNTEEEDDKSFFGLKGHSKWTNCNVCVFFSVSILIFSVKAVWNDFQSQVQQNNTKHKWY